MAFLKKAGQALARGFRTRRTLKRAKKNRRLAKNLRETRNIVRRSREVAVQRKINVRKARRRLGLK